MYEYIDNPEQVRVIGSFSHDKNADFKDSMKHLFEGFQETYQMDAITDITKILKLDSMKEAYKSELLGDVLNESFADDYYATMPEKLDQLFENSGLEILKESGVAALAPIVGITLPVLKKSYIEGHAKDIVMTEVPTKPIIKAAYERRFLKDAAGNKHYIPDIFYDDSYKTIMSQGRGLEISTAYYPTGDETVPFQDFNILAATQAEHNNNVHARDSLAYDFCIKSVMMQAGEELVPISVNIAPNMAANSSFNYRVKYTQEDGTVLEDIVVGVVDFYSGLVSVSSTKGLVKKVQFGGHLSNENNNETIELDRERELLEWKIPDGVRINTGLTLEKIKDYKALFDFDITTEIISDMSTVLAQYEDSEILGHLNDRYDEWKGRHDLPFGYTDGFVEEGNFSCEPPSNKFVTRSQWIESELKFDLNRFIDELKVKLRNQDLMFIVYGHPNLISLIQDNVRWIIDDDTKIGGIQLDYKFGVYTPNKNRIHVISTMKCPKGRGLRVVAYPLTKDVITFKHYKYSLNIENAYRNALTPLTPNVMGTSRFLTTDVLPVQGELHIHENEFSLKSPDAPATSQVASPVISLASGTYTGTQTVTVTCPTPGADIYYTVDGSNPTTASEKMNGAITIAATSTLKVMANKTGMIQSAVVSAEYTINTATVGP